MKVFGLNHTVLTTGNSSPHEVSSISFAYWMAILRFRVNGKSQTEWKISDTKIKLFKTRHRWKPMKRFKKKKFKGRPKRKIKHEDFGKFYVCV